MERMERTCGNPSRCASAAGRPAPSDATRTGDTTMTAKKNRPAPRTAHDDPWAPDPRPDIPVAYTAAIAAAVIRCQHCERPVGLADAPAPPMTCTWCVKNAVVRMLGPDEPPF